MIIALDFDDTISRDQEEVCMKYRHKKRGTEYRILDDHASFQSSLDVYYDDLRVVVYQAVNGEKIYVRAYSEFFDGRFEEIK